MQGFEMENSISPNCEHEADLIRRTNLAREGIFDCIIDRRICTIHSDSHYRAREASGDITRLR